MSALPLAIRTKFGIVFALSYLSCRGLLALSWDIAFVAIAFALSYHPYPRLLPLPWFIAIPKGYCLCPGTLTLQCTSAWVLGHHHPRTGLFALPSAISIAPRYSLCTQLLSVPWAIAPLILLLALAIIHATHALSLSLYLSLSFCSPHLFVLFFFRSSSSQLCTQWWHNGIAHDVHCGRHGMIEMATG